MAFLLFAWEADLKVIQKRFGHKKYETTANICAQLMAGAQAAVTEKLTAMVQATKPEEFTA